MQTWRLDGHPRAHTLDDLAHFPRVGGFCLMVILFVRPSILVPDFHRAWVGADDKCLRGSTPTTIATERSERTNGARASR